MGGGGGETVPMNKITLVQPQTGEGKPKRRRGGGGGGGGVGGGWRGGGGVGGRDRWSCSSPLSSLWNPWSI